MVDAGRRPAGQNIMGVRHLEILVSGLEILVFWGPTTFFFLKIEQGRAILVSWLFGGRRPNPKSEDRDGHVDRWPKQ